MWGTNGAAVDPETGVAREDKRDQSSSGQLGKLLNAYAAWAEYYCTALGMLLPTGMEPSRWKALEQTVTKVNAFKYWRQFKICTF